MNERNPQRAVGRTIARIEEYGWTLQIVFTDNTKLMITPDGVYDCESVEATFHDDLTDD